MITKLFDEAKIPSHRAILVHVRLRGIQEKTGTAYEQLSAELLDALLASQPTVLLIPAFTIYSFMAVRIFHLDYSRSEVGRFSEEMRKRDFSRTPDPMYSVLDVLGTLPPDLNYLQSFGPGTVFDYLIKQDGIIINVDMPGFYATPVHQIEMEHAVPYRFDTVYEGHIQKKEGPWRKVNYRTYVRKVSNYGTGSYPPYNYQRRTDYLRGQGVLTESRSNGSHLMWAPLAKICPAIHLALAQDPCFLVDQTSA